MFWIFRFRNDDVTDIFNLEQQFSLFTSIVHDLFEKYFFYNKKCLRERQPKMLARWNLKKAAK